MTPTSSRLAQFAGSVLVRSVVLVAVALGSCALLVANLVEFQRPPRGMVPRTTAITVETQPPVKVARPAPRPIAMPKPPDKPSDRRISVAGAQGYTVVVKPDGSSYLEAPDGKHTPLAEAAADQESPHEAAARPAFTAKRIEDSQLVVLDEGVVSVPRGAIITFTGTDHLVTHDGDGSSVVYHADGRVERRDRPSRIDNTAARAAGRPPEERP